ncbi:hypothetical protein DPMN_174818 [Dreissena polymorpha]|uniref:Uncharacterized protein n=1 Tax=Dreissena polymorpha TaxID=45954 RepID=A0A9D4E428_DREPO|nr:hypothetical protein DPMN_174818 [Dreissena polymorpha]
MARQRLTRGAPGLVMTPCIVETDRIVIRDVQYQLEVNGCRNEEVNKHNAPYCAFQGYMARTDRQTDGRTADITSISPRFSKRPGITIKLLAHIVSLTKIFMKHAIQDW